MEEPATELVKSKPHQGSRSAVYRSQWGQNFI